MGIGMAVRKMKILLLAMAMAYLILLVSAGASGGGEAEADRIIQLPGQPKVEFQQYSGYITVDKVAGRALWYWLTEAVHPESKPLVLWFNGGPGCSSLAYGASLELGPFRINKNGALSLNHFAWNNVANMIFLETPAGVGFSYSNTSSDLQNANDQRSAKDALEFINRWLDRFPHYKQQEIYLAGESYAGHYIPQLAKEIITYNSKTKSPLNFKGILVGNPSIDNYYDGIGRADYLWTHALISDDIHRDLLDKCDYREGKPVTKECEEINDYVDDTVMGNINPYNIYARICKESNDTRKSLHLAGAATSSIFRRRRLMKSDPCAEDYTGIYYNRPDVQHALHANTTQIPYEWTDCSQGHLNYTHTNGTFSMLPLYNEMIAAGLRIWVFSGDADSVVPVTSTKYSLAQLKLRTKIPWHPWFVNKEVGGWSEVYEGLTFVTVRGAGHEVPMYRPKEALELFKSFLSGTPLPTF